jgi:catechol 2,3-dioxygenase-like lactoylglutathione lyase family enzyme
MGFHHLAIATRDTKANHDFYTRAMGFKLAKVEIGPTDAGGWAKHLFYDTGEGELMAFWELHDERVQGEWDPAISTALGLPLWVNHIAFTARGLEDIERRKRRWLEYGQQVMEIDHDWCHSIYTTDPNRILVEFCTMTRELTDEDAREAERLMLAEEPGELREPKTPKFFRPGR